MKKQFAIKMEANSPGHECKQRQGDAVFKG